ncbi:PaaI family thioesterase [Pseudooceanicola sp. MF1-13]|uniref:PaaI family thioesterase n=1 Tax=Pseudooceanicola sp. MF1-13 TaxID=3379095 RepID=UPI0038913385
MTEDIPRTDPNKPPATDKAAKIARQFMEALPYAKAIGMQVIHVGAGTSEFALPYRDDLVGDPDTGVLHGGAVSALLDSACGAAVISHPDSAGGTATLDLRIDYMRAATPGQTLVGQAECYHVTRSVAFVRAVALDDDTDRPVAAATGAFTFKMTS